MIFSQEIEDLRKQFKVEVWSSMIDTSVIQIMSESSGRAIVQSITLISIIKSLDFRREGILSSVYFNKYLKMLDKQTAAEN